MFSFASGKATGAVAQAGTTIFERNVRGSEGREASATQSFVANLAVQASNEKGGVGF